LKSKKLKITMRMLYQNYVHRFAQVLKSGSPIEKMVRQLNMLMVIIFGIKTDSAIEIMVLP